MDEVEDGKAESAVVVLCGLPASGKSTFAANLTQYLQTSSERVQVVAVSFDAQYDDLKRSSESFDLDAWHASRAGCKATATRLLKESKADNARWRLLLIDDNMQLTSMRHEWFRLARDCRCSYLQIYFKCPLELCRSRNLKRASGAVVKEDVLVRMAGSFNEPAPEKHTWEESTITIDTSVTNTADPKQLDQIWNNIFDLWGSPPPVGTTAEEKEALEREGRLANANSLLHAVDESSRKLLSNAMQALAKKGVQSSALRRVGRELNIERREMLDRCRNLGPDASSSAVAELEQSFSNACDETVRSC